MDTETEEPRPDAFEDLPENLSYVPQGTGSGIQVRIWREKKRHQKFFALSHFETPEDCLAAARYWRDIKLQRLPEKANAEVNQTEEVRRRVSQAMTRTGIRGLGFYVGRKGDAFRMYAVAHFRRDGALLDRMRSLHKHGVDGTAAQLSRYLAQELEEHEGKDPALLATECATALRRVISRIYHMGAYPPSRHGHEKERYQVLKQFVEKDDTLPVGVES